MRDCNGHKIQVCLKKKRLYLSVEVFSAVALIGDTINQ